MEGDEGEWGRGEGDREECEGLGERVWELERTGGRVVVGDGVCLVVAGESDVIDLDVDRNVDLDVEEDLDLLVVGLWGELREDGAKEGQQRKAKVVS